MSLDKFLADLKGLADSDTKGFRSRSNQWHSDLAAALQAAMTKEKYSDGKKLSQIPLIPLRNGKWISGSDIKENNIRVFFPSHSLGCELPTGLTYDFVDAKAASFQNRKWLFEWLGVGEIDNRTLAQHILEVHGNENNGHKQLSLDNILSQLLFLYNTGWTKPENSDTVLWMPSENDQRYVGTDLYLDSQDRLSASRLFVDCRDEFPFLHPYIVNGNPENPQRWHKWLEDHAGLSCIPRLFRRLQCHKDFTYISQTRGLTTVLQLLKVYWNYYRHDIERDYTIPRDDESNELRKELARTISYMKVRCTDGVERPLNHTFLPMVTIVKDAADVLPYLDIPDPEDKSWVYVLGFFRVGCEENLRFYIKCLECVKRVPQDSQQGPSHSLLSRLFELIQVRASGDEELVL
jgi:hypothetical protein